MAPTYDECRALFHRIAGERGVAVRSIAIDERGPLDEVLTIDWVHLGAVHPERVLVVMSGVHGVEGFVGSRLLCELLASVEWDRWATGDALVMVHSVNPWGMAWGRRQNESNVDLNRNWRRDTLDEAPRNPGYDEVHHLLCPRVAHVPDPALLVEALLPYVEARGMSWVRDAIATGQYGHPDGFHFGGVRTEPSTAILEALLAPVVRDAAEVLTLDLHTGHGDHGSVTLLSDDDVGGPQDRWLRVAFGADAIEATGRPDDGVGRATGQIAHGVRDLIGVGATAFAAVVEFGTVSDVDQLMAAHREWWVHHHGDRSDPGHRDVLRAYRNCFTPDDPRWEATALDHGRRILGRGLEAIFGV